jgi:predicted nucleotidyltransferase
MGIFSFGGCPMVKGFQTEAELLIPFIEMLRASLQGGLKKVILFGSHARHENEEGSDYDCLVVVDTVNRKVIQNIDTASGEFLFINNEVLSAFPISLDEFEHKEFDPLLRNIKREGIVVWA